MFDYNRGAKAGGIAGLIIGLINALLTLVVLAATWQSIAEIAENLPTGLTVTLIIAELWQKIISGLIAGGIFGIIYAAVYNKLPGSSSRNKGLVFGFIYWIFIGIILGYFISFQRQGMMYFLIFYCGLGLIISFLWGFLIGKLWDKYGPGKKEIEEFQTPKGKVIYFKEWKTILAAGIIITIIGIWMFILYLMSVFEKFSSGFGGIIGYGIIFLIIGIILILGGLLTRKKPQT